MDDMNIIPLRRQPAIAAFLAMARPGLPLPLHPLPIGDNLGEVARVSL